MPSPGICRLREAAGSTWAPSGSQERGKGCPKCRVRAHPPTFCAHNVASSLPAWALVPLSHWYGLDICELCFCVEINWHVPRGENSTPVRSARSVAGSHFGRDTPGFLRTLQTLSSFEVGFLLHEIFNEGVLQIRLETPLNLLASLLKRAAPGSVTKSQMCWEHRLVLWRPRRGGVSPLGQVGADLSRTHRPALR